MLQTCCCVVVCAESDLGESLLDGLSLLHLGEVVVVQRHVGHDGLLIGMSDYHVVHLQQLHDAELPLGQSECMLQVTPGVVAMETMVVKKIGSWLERDRDRNMEKHTYFKKVKTFCESAHKDGKNVCVRRQACYCTGGHG